MGVLRLKEAPPDAREHRPPQRFARRLSGLIVLGDERDRRMRAQVQAEALSRSDELKTALLRAVTHDLRSPLMAITTAAGGLGYAGSTTTSASCWRRSPTRASRMSRMIENLLDMSKLRRAPPPRVRTGSTLANWSRRRSTS